MKRAFALLAPVALVIGLAACGGDDDDDPDTTSATEETATEDTATESTSEEESSSGTTGDAQTDMMQQIFPDLSEEQVSCLTDAVGSADPAEIASQAQEIAETCDIDPSDLTPDMSAISIPDLSNMTIPEGFEDQLKEVFPNLDDESVSCLVEGLGGTLDMSRLQEVISDCGIDPSEMVGG